MDGKKVNDIMQYFQNELMEQTGKGRVGYAADEPHIRFLFQKIAEQQIQIEKLREEITSLMLSIR